MNKNKTNQTNKISPLIIAIVVLIVIGVVFFALKSKKTDSNVSSSRQVEEQELAEDSSASDTKTDSNEASDQASTNLTYNLQDNKTFTISGLNNVYFEVVQSSTPSDLVIVFATSKDKLEDLVVPIISVVPIKTAKDRVNRVKTQDTYPSYIAEYMAVVNSTQCAMLRASNVTKKQIGDKTVYVGNQSNKCTYNTKTPYTQVIKLYGFEQNGYVVTLGIVATDKDVPDNLDQTAEAIIKAIEIK